MSKKTLSMLAMLAAMGAAFENPNAGSSLRPEDIDTTPKKKPIPKGCKEYWFDDEGFFSNGFERERPIRKDQVVFYCIASSDKKAREKFNKYKSKL